jgi:hypothetical protein
MPARRVRRLWVDGGRSSDSRETLLRVENAFGGARALGGAEGKRLTYDKSSPHSEHERLDGPWFSGTSLDLDHRRRIRPPHCDGRSDRSRLTRTQA